MTDPRKDATKTGPAEASTSSPVEGVQRPNGAGVGASTSCPRWGQARQLALDALKWSDERRIDVIAGVVPLEVRRLARELLSALDALDAARKEAEKLAACRASAAVIAAGHLDAIRERDRLAEAIHACIGDAEGQEAVAPGSRKVLTLTNGQARLLAAALAAVSAEGKP